jgi:hypothetical protein
MLENKDAPGTVKTQETGLRWWIRFTTRAGVHYFLFEASDLPLDYEAKERVEMVLLVFTAFLGRVDKPKQLLGDTIRNYVGHVKAMHVKLARGRAFKDVIDSTSRLQSLYKVLKAARPSGLRLKVGFSAAHFRIFSATVDRLKKQTQSEDMLFLLDRIRVAVATLLTCVLRASEVVDNTQSAAANRAPILVADIKFMSGVGKDAVEMPRTPDGKVPAGSTFAVSRMPPHKGDNIQRVGNELYFPGKYVGAEVNGAKECVENFLNDYPVGLHFQQLVPLLRSVRLGPAGQMTRAMFLHDFKLVCRAAGLRYSQWGTHAFRVGGMNELQDAGAGVAEIMAIGHWRSDAWLIYSRRNRAKLMQWSGQILCPKSTSCTKALMAASSGGQDSMWEAKDVDSDVD